jgi:diadenosine tetraphosphate (Ap4A) HIT family hydrolase
LDKRPFTISEQLAADTHTLGMFDCSHVLLHSNAIVPWVILVPICTETEFLKLPTLLRDKLVAESAAVGEFIQDHFGSTKINFAAIGNIVPQLHLHIVGRVPGDICWPSPIWGNLSESKNYTDREIQSVVDGLKSRCDLR